jgi:hypothetical protein
MWVAQARRGGIDVSRADYVSMAEAVPASRLIILLWVEIAGRNMRFRE